MEGVNSSRSVRTNIKKSATVVQEKNQNILFFMASPLTPPGSNKNGRFVTRTASALSVAYAKLTAGISSKTTYVTPEEMSIEALDLIRRDPATYMAWIVGDVYRIIRDQYLAGATLAALGGAKAPPVLRGTEAKDALEYVRPAHVPGSELRVARAEDAAHVPAECVWDFRDIVVLPSNHLLAADAVTPQVHMFDNRLNPIGSIHNINADWKRASSRSIDRKLILMSPRTKGGLVICAGSPLFITHYSENRERTSVPPCMAGKSGDSFVAGVLDFNHDLTVVRANFEICRYSIKATINLLPDPTFRFDAALMDSLMRDYPACDPASFTVDKMRVCDLVSPGQVGSLLLLVVFDVMPNIRCLLRAVNDYSGPSVDSATFVLSYFAPVHSIRDGLHGFSKAKLILDRLGQVIVFRRGQDAAVNGVSVYDLAGEKEPFHFMLATNSRRSPHFLPAGAAIDNEGQLWVTCITPRTHPLLVYNYREWMGLPPAAKKK